MYFLTSETKITTDLEIVFEKPIRILFPSQASVDGQHMQIHFASDTDIELVVEQTLPDCCNVIQVRISPHIFII